VLAMEAQEYGVGTRRLNLPITPSMASNFDHEAKIYIENTQKERVEGVVAPTGGLSGDGPYEFVIPAVADGYLLCANLALYMKARIVSLTGADINAGDVVAPINLLGCTMWEGTEIMLNDYVVSGASTSNTHYKSYLETLLSYDHTSQRTHLAAQMFEMDKPGEFETMTAVPGTGNPGFCNRRTLVANSVPFDLMSPITADFLRSHNHLAPGNKLNIKLYRARDEFVLNSKDAKVYKLELLDLKLHYQRVRSSLPPPKIERYQTTRTELKRFPVAPDMTEYNFVVHHAGKMPTNIIIAQVDTRAADGHFGSNPLHLKHNDVSVICLRVNGRQVPANALRTNFGANPPLTAQAFVHLFQNTGSYRTDRGNCITKQAFDSGTTIFAFDLNPDMCNGAHLHESELGTISVELVWSKPLPATTTILAHCSWSEVITHKKNEGIFSISTI
jgi:hypothetical protein